jgi:hypothetical protein
MLHAEGETSLPLRGYIVPELHLAHVGYSRPAHFPEDLTEEVSFDDMKARLKEYGNGIKVQMIPNGPCLCVKCGAVARNNRMAG